MSIRVDPWLKPLFSLYNSLHKNFLLHCNREYNQIDHVKLKLYIFSLSFSYQKYNFWCIDKTLCIVKNKRMAIVVKNNYLTGEIRANSSGKSREEEQGNPFIRNYTYKEYNAYLAVKHAG